MFRKAAAVMTIAGMLIAGLMIVLPTSMATDGGGCITVTKYYDANANGIYDGGDSPIEGWLIEVRSYNSDAYLEYGFTDANGQVSFSVLDGTYVVTEIMPIETCWMSTTPTSGYAWIAGCHEFLYFGNLCLCGDGGRTPGFWSNKNGLETMNDGGTVAPELALLSGLNLKDANGNNFDPSSYDAFKTWLQARDATNMAYQLSAHLAAMELNVEAGLVDAGALVYAPGVTGVNAGGFISVSGLMTAANNALGADGYTPAGDANRAPQEVIKNALDAANNNLNFVQDGPCSITYPIG